MLVHAFPLNRLDGMQRVFNPRRHAYPTYPTTYTTSPTYALIEQFGA